ncbi:Histone-lysine N-methyltransferase, H3 lysine-79 specific, partial [Frankliniella fusca]
MKFLNHTIQPEIDSSIIYAEMTQISPSSCDEMKGGVGSKSPFDDNVNGRAGSKSPLDKVKGRLVNKSPFDMVKDRAGSESPFDDHGNDSDYMPDFNDADISGDEIFKSPPKKRLDHKSTPVKPAPAVRSCKDNEGKSRKSLNSFFDNMSVVSKLGKKVTVSELPIHFNENILLYVLNNCLYDVNYCDRTIKPAISCKKDGPSSAIVEFMSIDAASLVCDIKSAKYEGLPLKMEQEEVIPEIV